MPVRRVKERAAVAVFWALACSRRVHVGECHERCRSVAQQVEREPVEDR
jgi:hypothetical protein